MTLNRAAILCGGVIGGGWLARPIENGVKDDLWLDKGVLATNAQLVDRAVGIIERMGARVIGPEEVRERLGLQKRASR